MNHHINHQKYHPEVQQGAGHARDDATSVLPDFAGDAAEGLGADCAVPGAITTKTFRQIPGKSR